MHEHEEYAAELERHIRELIEERKRRGVVLGYASLSEDRPRYKPTTTFETFPSPMASLPTSLPSTTLATRAPSPSPKPRAAGEAFRDHWLNPPEWVEWVDAPGRPAKLETFRLADSAHLKHPPGG